MLNIKCTIKVCTTPRPHHLLVSPFKSEAGKTRSTGLPWCWKEEDLGVTRHGPCGGHSIVVGTFSHWLWKAPQTYRKHTETLTCGLHVGYIFFYVHSRNAPHTASCQPPLAWHYGLEGCFVSALLHTDSIYLHNVVLGGAF